MFYVDVLWLWHLNKLCLQFEFHNQNNKHVNESYFRDWLLPCAMNCMCLCIFYCVIWVRLREKFIVYRFHLYEYWLLWMSLLFAGVLHEPESGKSFDMWLWNASTQKCAYIFPFAKLNRITHTHTNTQFMENKTNMKFSYMIFCAFQLTA